MLKSKHFTQFLIARLRIFLNLIISNKFRMVCKVDENLQLDSRDWSMYSSHLKLVYLTEDPFLQNKLSNFRIP